MKRRIARTLSLSVVVCLLALLFSSAALAQANPPSKSQSSGAKGKVQPASKTTPKVEAPVITSVSAKNVPAADNAFLSPLEREIIDEMNLARTEPQKYAAFVEEFRKFYDGNRLSIPGRKKTIVTNDGIAAVDEAIKFLRAQQPLPAFMVSRGVCSAAADHAKDLAKTGISGHRGSDGSLPNARVDRYGSWEGSIGETIVYDLSPARQIMIALIIDDGVPNRGHRRNIFDPNYKLTGLSVSQGDAFGSKCVIVYVGGFKEKSATDK